MVKSAPRVLLLLLLLGAFCCASNTSNEVSVNIDNLKPQVELPPGYPATLQGSTLVIQGFPGTPVVHSYPKYAGVENVGDIGLGSAAGFDVGDSFYVPINVNLGSGQLTSYKVCIAIDAPATMRLLGISGSNQLLSQYYPDQYARAQGFEKIPQKSESPLCVWDIASGTAATGRVNLAELQFSVVQTLPATGVNLTVELENLEDASENDLCPTLAQAGCALKNGIVIHNFLINN
jgi:hypothetical protein